MCCLADPSAGCSDGMLIPGLSLDVIPGLRLGVLFGLSWCVVWIFSWLFCWCVVIWNSFVGGGMLLNFCARCSSTTAGHQLLCHTSKQSKEQGPSFDCESIADDQWLLRSSAHKFNNVPCAKPCQNCFDDQKVSNIHNLGFTQSWTRLTATQHDDHGNACPT